MYNFDPLVNCALLRKHLLNVQPVPAVLLDAGFRLLDAEKP